MTSPQLDEFHGPVSITPGKVDKLKGYLDFTYMASGIDHAAPADEESAYNLGANHAFYDTLELLHDVEGEPAPKKDHSKRNIVIAMTVGGAIGAFIGSGEAEYQLRRQWLKYKRKVTSSEHFKAYLAKKRPPYVKGENL